MMMAPVSAVPPEVFALCTRTVKDPSATSLTLTMVPPLSEPERMDTTTTSPMATAEFVTTKSAVSSAARDAVCVVMVPQTHGFGDTVTPVVRLVSCVTAPPAPVA